KRACRTCSSTRPTARKARTAPTLGWTLAHPKSRSADMTANATLRSGSAGYTLMEMIMVLLIVSVLAALAAPVAANRVAAEKEFALRAALREVRTAIDRFHSDWEDAKGGGGFAKAASQDGYPLSFDVLRDGVDGGGASGRKKRYLRAVPRNPFVP